MKSPDKLREKLRAQWHKADWREARLLNREEAWPLVLRIGRPAAALLRSDFDAVKRHLQAWRGVRVGEVQWEEVGYRDAAEPMRVPVAWRLCKPSEWAAACADRVVSEEFATLAAIAEHTDAVFHPLLIRRRSLWREKPLGEVGRAARLAATLQPGASQGRSLRMLPLEGIDTKFFERNAHLVTSLLDVRFGGEVAEVGLEAFLGAHAEHENWLLLLVMQYSCPWRDLDSEFGPWQSAYHWFNKWASDGTLDEILHRLIASHIDVGEIDDELWCVDGTHIRAARCAAGGGKKESRKSPATML